MDHGSKAHCSSWAKEQRTISTCKGTYNGTSMDYAPANSTVDCVVGTRRVESAHANNSTLTLLLLLLCVPKLTMFPSITGYHTVM